LLRANDAGDLDSSGKKDLHLLLGGNLLSVSKELLHGAIVVALQEVFEAVSGSELLVSVGQERDVEKRQEILALLGLRSSDDDDEFLLSLRTEFESDSFGEFLRDRILNEPRLVLELTVHNCVVVLSTLLLSVKRERQLRIAVLILDLSLVEAESLRINRQLNDLLILRSVSDLQSRAEQLARVESGVVKNVRIHEDGLSDILNPVLGLPVKALLHLLLEAVHKLSERSSKSIFFLLQSVCFGLLLVRGLLLSVFVFSVLGFSLAFLGRRLLFSLLRLFGSSRLVQVFQRVVTLINLILNFLLKLIHDSINSFFN
jgi:hypothetical protein